MAAAPPNFLLEPTPHEEAAKWLRDKPVVSREVFDSLLPELKGRAFLITGIEDANVSAEVREIIAKVPEGLSWEAAKREIVGKLGPWLSGEDDEQKAANARAELLLRTHGFQAYQVTQHRVMRGQEDVFPFWQYLTLGDEKVRPAHAALNDKVAPADSPFWHDHSPPWQWGCRCRKVPLLPDEVDEMRDADAALPPERRRVLDGEALKLAEQGRMYNAAGQQLDIKSDRQKGKDGGYTFDPDALTLPLSDLKARYDPQTWAEFEENAKKTTLPDGRDVWSWLNGEKAKKAKKTTETAVKAAKKTAVAAPAVAPKPAIPAVSDALTMPADPGDKALAEHVASVIDSIHGDGVLPTAAVESGTVAQIDALGDYNLATNRIRFARNGDWPHMTMAHETGHFIDRRALGDASTFGSVTRSTPEMQAWWKAVQDSPSFQAITSRKAGTQSRADYFTTPWEAWARSYAQFIAIESSDPQLLADLDRIHNSGEPWRQWQADEFKPIADGIRNIIKSKGWNR